ncbi:T-cell leukemia/lymphoma protein 1A-like [Myotis daubentonii]|uniref:T-cell leukemia/lymphoma protein 1A-like n=1 Tax=Myotis daubentonii TaxID=98922 RepID=UPI002873B2EA|nr:T-cell leukemia/lymphoma protein 1A-like [Myotis daubentonii]
MAELPAKVHLTSHPFRLKIRGPLVYEDENHRTWVHLVIKTIGVLQVRLRQENIAIENIGLNPITLTSSSMPWMWTLHPVGQYVDPMYRFWRILHHVKENGVEEMILELMKDA